MRKSIRILSIFAMAFVMSLSFFFASTLFAKAEANVGMSVIDGAKVFVAGTADDIGINFTVNLDKDDYDALVASAQAEGKSVKAGALFGSPSMPDQYFTIQDCMAFYADALESEEDVYSFDAEFLFNIAEMYEQDFVDVQDKPTLDQYRNMVVNTPISAKPFIAVYQGEYSENTAEFTYGETSAARTMAGVANAVGLAGEAVPEVFFDKYNVNTVEGATSLVVNPDGTIVGDITAVTGEVVYATVGSNATLFVVEDGALINQFGSYVAPASVAPAGMSTISFFAADTNSNISVYTYEAIFYDEIIDSLAADPTGKVYFNATSSYGIEFDSALVNGVEVLVDGKIDLAAINVGVGDKFTASFSSEDANVIVNEIEVYDYVFENTRQSRKQMVELFSCRSLSEGRILDGKYALAENIYFNRYEVDAEGNQVFDQDGSVRYSREEAFVTMVGKGTIEYEEDGEPLTKEVYNKGNIFKGTFDGRGFALNDIILESSMFVDINDPKTKSECHSIFSIAGDGATFKNLGINKVYRFKHEYDCADKGGYNAVFFVRPYDENIEVLFENVYAYRYLSESNLYSGILAYGGDINKGFGYTTFTNCFWQATSIDPDIYSSTSHRTQIFGSVSVHDMHTFNDSYFVSNSRLCSGSDTETLDGVTSYFTIDMMRKAYNDYSSFSTKYWTVIDGIPYWNSIHEIAILKNAAGERVNSIYADNADEVYTVTLTDCSAPTRDFTLETLDVSVITIDGNRIKPVAGAVGTTKVKVHYNDHVVYEFDVAVDVRPTQVVDEEILFSERETRLFFNGTSLAGDEVMAASFNGESILSAGRLSPVDVKKEYGYNNKFTLNVSTNSGRYQFTNVKLYTDVFENTAYSRQSFVNTFGTKASITTKSIEGYYVLAENLTFNHYDETGAASKLEAMGGKTGAGIFDATFDGRGFTLNNVLLDHSTNYNYGMFAQRQGMKAVLKNFAINNVYFYSAGGITSKATAGYGSLLFSKPSYVAAYKGNISTIENVYIYAKVTSDSKTIRLFYASKAVTGDLLTFGFANWNNVLFVYENGDDTSTNVSKKYLISSTDRGEAPEAEDKVTFNNAYFVNNSYVYDTFYASSTDFSALGEGFNAYQNVAALTAANKDYSAFSTDYWTIAEGAIPVWKTLPVATN